MENRSRVGELQVRRIVSRYELGQQLGSGAYSQVFRGRHLDDGGVFAIKVISNRVLAQNSKVKECISNQLAIHNVLEPCPHIVRFHELLQTRNNCYFVYEYCEGGTLHQLLRREGPLEEKRAVGVFAQLVAGLKVLRRHNIMHRDLKPENVLIKEGHFKLADFGFCKELGIQGMTRTMLGSPLYMAPEVLRGEAYSVNADVWSVGVILFEMLYGRCPFQSHSIASLISAIDDTNLVFDPSPHVSSNIKRFITRCLQKDCRIRMTWQQLFEQASKLQQAEHPVHPVTSLQTFPRSFTRITEKAGGSTILENKETTPAKGAISKSKYELFKENYHRRETEGIRNDSQILHGDQMNRPERSRSITLKEKDKAKDGRVSYSQMIQQHEACFKLLQGAMEVLESREKKGYASISSLLRGVKRVLEKIYTRINLEDTEMLPVLSIVKYELIQLEKVQSEVQKVLPFQTHEELSINQKGLSPHLCELWASLQVACPL